MKREHVIIACGLSLLLGALIGIYWHSQIVRRTVRQMQREAVKTVHTERELPTKNSPQ